MLVTAGVEETISASKAPKAVPLLSPQRERIAADMVPPAPIA